MYRCFLQCPEFCKQFLRRRAELSVMFRTLRCWQSGFTGLSKLPWYPSQRRQSPDWKPAACRFFQHLHSGLRVHQRAPQTCHAAICLVTLWAEKSKTRKQYCILVPCVLERNSQRLDRDHINITWPRTFRKALDLSHLQAIQKDYRDYSTQAFLQWQNKENPFCIMKAVINKAFTWVDKKHLSPKKK